MNSIARQPATFVRGVGPYLITDKGDHYLDFFCDVGTASLGYNSDTMTRALEKMLRYGIPIHAPNRYGFSDRTSAAKRICAMADMDKVFLCNSGTEAVEAAIKLARLYHHKNGKGHRRGIWSVPGAFHGRTYGALSAGDGPVYHTEGFGKLLDDFHSFEAIHSIDPQAAAVILAPIFGNNDVRPYSLTWLSNLSDFCLANDIVLIFDEVQTGGGRTGKLTYAQKIGAYPDLITLAKGIAGGAPVGALLARGRFGDVFTPGTHFSTFGGNPFSCVMLEFMLDWLKYNFDNIEETGRNLRHALQCLSWAKDVRGEGMLWAFDYEGDVQALADAAFEEKLLIGAFRAGPGPVKISPPLNIEQADLIRGIASLDAAHRSLSR
jgi:acetylornithine/N-succinyldiaminopimelate aminotransferase